MFELKVMEPGASKFDYIATHCNTSWAKQRWHAGKWLPDQEGGSRILFNEAHESDQCCVAAPRNTTTLPNCWQGQHFGALRLLRNETKIQVNFLS